MLAREGEFFFQNIDFIRGLRGPGRAPLGRRTRTGRRDGAAGGGGGGLPGGLSGGDKVPAGRAQRNFSVQRGHAPLPLPPPVVIVCARGGPTATGGGRLFYTSHFKGGRWSPVATAHRRSPLPLRSVLDAPHRGAGPEAAAETEAPFGTPTGRRMSGENLLFGNWGF